MFDGNEPPPSYLPIKRVGFHMRMSHQSIQLEFNFFLFKCSTFYWKGIPLHANAQESSPDSTRIVFMAMDHEIMGMSQLPMVRITLCLFSDWKMQPLHSEGIELLLMGMSF